MSNPYSSISFTDVASRYNRINTIPDDAAITLGKSIANLSEGEGLVLDMGCGAGRIAIPAVQAGVNVLGVEIDSAMLQQATRGAKELTFHGVQGDIVQLPLADNSMSVVLSINVLHLVPAWQEVLQEAVRVLQPNGLFVQGRDWLDPASCAGQLRFKLREVVMGLMPNLRPTAAASPKVMAEALTAMGGTMQESIVATRWVVHQSPADILEQMAHRQHNETWMLTDDVLAEAVQQLTAWANDTWDDIHAVQAVEKQFLLTPTTGLA
ncbi:MAG: class I SAM-dependent methyltransferase [Chloroflexota bacterium]